MNQEQIEAINRVQRYIDENLKHSMSLRELANVAGYSPSYTSTLFKEVVGEGLFQYMRKLRLSKAALTLRDGGAEQRVLDVALDYVFNSHEGFTKAFSRLFGVAPKAYQMKPQPINLFMPYDVKSVYEHQKIRRRHTEMKEKTIFVQVIEKPQRKLLLKRGVKATHYFEYCEEVGCDVWGMLISVKEALGEPMGLWLPEKLKRPDTSEYVQGVEVPMTYTGVVPEGYELIDLAPCKMMIFQGAPYDDEEFGDAIEALWQAIERYDPALYGFAWDLEESPRFQLEPQGYRGYMEGRPVKQLV